MSGIPASRILPEMNLARWHFFRIILAVISLVNLSFLLVWRELIFSNPADSYWMPSFQFESYLAALVNVGMLSLIVFALVYCIKKWKSRLRNLVAVFLAIIGLILPLNYFRMVVDLDAGALYWLEGHEAKVLVVGLVFLGLCVMLCLVYFKYFMQCAIGVLLIFSPFAVITLSQVAWKAIEQLQQQQMVADVIYDKQIGLSGKKKQRIVWIIFDELDYRLAFQGRPGNIDLQNFDRFKSQAIFATKGMSHSKNTEEAIPSFLTGKLVQQAEPLGPAILRLKFDDPGEPQSVSWIKQANIFSQAYTRGASIGIIGLYHPYCRLFLSQYAFCSWYALNTYAPQASTSVLQEMTSQLKGITPVSRRLNAISTYNDMLDTSSKVVEDPRYDFVYIHASVPHGPDIYNSLKKDFTVFNLAKAGYFDNLLLADKFLGEIRKHMEDANLWDSSVVLITSDHEWRHVYLYDNRRVRKIPFLLKMPGQKVEVTYNKSMSPMLVTKNLLLEIFDGNLHDPRAVLSWLNTHSDSLSYCQM